MIKVWVLIILTMGGPVTPVYFASESACLSAMTVVRAVSARFKHSFCAYNAVMPMVGK